MPRSELTVFDQVAIIDFQLGPDNTLVQSFIRNGQLISKLFWCHQFFQKNERKTSALVAKAKFCKIFVRFLGE